MIPSGEDIFHQLRERFRLTFQQRLREHLARQGSLADAFRVTWERTLQEIRLDELVQANVYWELVQWAYSYDMFTTGEHLPPTPPQAQPSRTGPPA